MFNLIKTKEQLNNLKNKVSILDNINVSYMYIA